MKKTIVGTANKTWRIARLGYPVKNREHARSGHIQAVIDSIRGRRGAAKK